MSSHPFDVFDTAPLVCFIEGKSDPVFYGPFSPADAADFIGKWNAFFAERNLPGTWVARPIVSPDSIPSQNRK